MTIDPNVLGTVTFMLPIITLFIGFLVLKWDALKVSVAAWVVEVIIILIAYPDASIMRATIWANIDLWSAYAVIWTGFLFSQMYRNTGLLERLIQTLDSLFKSNWGKALTLSGVVGGLIGAFNGFATYPVTISGIKELGYENWRAAIGYLVFFSWMVPFVSLWIGGTIAQVGSHIPIIEFAPYIGALSIPLVFVSAIGFSHILEVNLKEPHNLALLLLTVFGGLTGIILFTILLPDFYIFTLIGSSIFTLIYLVAYKKSRNLEGEKIPGLTLSGMIRPFAPIIIGIVIILLWGTEPIKSIVAKAAFTLDLWGFTPIKINLISNPGFYILIIALASYLFVVKPPAEGTKPSTPLKDIITGSKISANTLITLFFGGGLVGIMTSAGQITAVRNILEQLSAIGYSVVLTVFSFISGIVFAAGVSADLLLSAMQVGVSVGVPIAFLVAIVALVVMGPANPLKPALLYYTATIAEAPPNDHPTMFRTALVWQVLALVIIIIEVAITVWFFL